MLVPMMVSLLAYQVAGEPVKYNQADGSIVMGGTTFTVERWYELIERLKKSHQRGGFIPTPKPKSLPGRPLPWLLAKLFRKHYWY